MLNNHIVNYFINNSKVTCSCIVNNIIIDRSYWFDICSWAVFYAFYWEFCGTARFYDFPSIMLDLTLSCILSAQWNSESLHNSMNKEIGCYLICSLFCFWRKMWKVAHLIYYNIRLLVICCYCHLHMTCEHNWT